MSNPNDPDVMLIARRERDLKKYSAQIGRMCTLWSGLEFDIALLLISVAGLDDPLNKNVFLGVLDMRAKINAILALGFKGKPTEDWYERLTTVINKIDNELRTERNRTIHDFWFVVPSETDTLTMHRVTLRAKVRNTPPSGAATLHLADFKAVTPAEIAALCAQIIESNVALNRLRREFELSPLSGKPQTRVTASNPSPDHKP